MKANSIWTGHDYACIPNKGKTQRYANNVQRVKVRASRRRKEYGNKNATTYLVVDVYDWDGIEILQSDVEIRAYFIVDFWADFHGEYHEQLEKIKSRRMEAERAEIERKQKKEMIEARLKLRGIDINDRGVRFNSYGDLTIMESALNKWLGIEVEANVSS